MLDSAFAPIRIALAAVLVIGARPAAAAVEEYLTREQALALAFPAPAHVEKRIATLTAEAAERLAAGLRRERAPRVFTYWAGIAPDGAILGYAAFDDVRGKSEPITYMLSVDGSLHVQAVEILAYRESHGGEIRREAFRRQFSGKDSSAKLELGDDIRNIAGATISCRSITDGVHDLLQIFAAALPRSKAAQPESPSASPSSPAVAGTDQVFERCQMLMGTTLEVHVYAADRAAADRAMGAAFAEVARLEDLLSHFRPASEVGRLNLGAGGPALPVSAETFEVLQAALDVARASAGAFTPCAGSLMALWAEAARRGEWPAAEDVVRARELAGPSQLVLDPAARTARLARPGAAVDLGGIGKGYALDRAAAALKTAGVRRALLDFGGQLLAVGAPPGRAGWPVAISDPRGGATALRVIDLCDASLASTSNAERGSTLAGRPVSHVVDPRSGESALALAGVSVLAPTALEADAWSTAVFVLGPVDGAAAARARGLGALLVAPDGAQQACGALDAATQRTTPAAEPRQ